jgi:hypothetical protein
LCQALGHGQDAHATCATVNRQMRPVSGKSHGVLARPVSACHQAFAFTPYLSLSPSLSLHHQPSTQTLNHFA